MSTPSTNPIENNEADLSVAETLLDTDDARAEIVEMLGRNPRRLPTKLLYDERGSKLFDQICEQPEYYPTRTEISILRDNADEIAQHIGDNCRFVEFGSGSSTKTPILLDALRNPVSYVPIDISHEHLAAAADRIAAAYPDLPVAALVADYMQPIELPESAGDGPTVAFFPGSTIGNFEKQEALEFLQRVARMVGARGELLLGVDLRKDRAILEPAYNDAAGVTADFNLNILTVLNRDFDAQCDESQFAHRAVYDPHEGRIEMRIISLTNQELKIGGQTFPFREGDYLITEYSHKYTLQDFEQLADKAGWDVDHVWTDDQNLFSVQLLRVKEEHPAA